MVGFKLLWESNAAADLTGGGAQVFIRTRGSGCKALVAHLPLNSCCMTGFLTGQGPVSGLGTPGLGYDLGCVWHRIQDPWKWGGENCKISLLKTSSVQKWKLSRQVRCPDGERCWWARSYNLPEMTGGWRLLLQLLFLAWGQDSFSWGALWAHSHRSWNLWNCPSCPKSLVPARPKSSEQLNVVQACCVQCGRGLQPQGRTCKGSLVPSNGEIRDASCRKSQVGWALEDGGLPLQL